MCVKLSIFCLFLHLLHNKCILMSRQWQCSFDNRISASLLLSRLTYHSFGQKTNQKRVQEKRPITISQNVICCIQISCKSLYLKSWNQSSFCCFCLCLCRSTYGPELLPKVYTLLLRSVGFQPWFCFFSWTKVLISFYVIRTPYPLKESVGSR